MNEYAHSHGSAGGSIAGAQLSAVDTTPALDRLGGRTNALVEQLSMAADRVERFVTRANGPSALVSPGEKGGPTRPVSGLIDAMDELLDRLSVALSSLEMSCVALDRIA